MKGIPRFADVLCTVLADVEIEASLIAAEASGSVIEAIVRAEGLSPSSMTHEELKALLPSARFDHSDRRGDALRQRGPALRCDLLKQLLWRR